ncbi:uncharacterized protein LOC102446049 isoform X2 [Pelodiscus sinensis]|uniref:uncharacterized protein LOC102446049 isoform X2 n=1 Tax=Pelodiscus sinensis TaxID=13735 RepID=UPI003F6CDEEB
MDQLCKKCVKLLQDFVSLVKRIASSLIQNIKEYLILISKCSCLKQKGSESRQLYNPVLQPHEKETAREFLQHIETGFQMSPFGKDSLEALRTLAFSENPALQQSAALYYLHMSQHLNIQLPAEHLEPFYALLQSSDMEVQQMSSLSLVNFLLEGNMNKELVVQMGLLEPILELLESCDSTVQCNSCACIMTLAVSESNQEAISSAGVVPLLALANSYDPRIQQNAVGAILNLTRSERIQKILCKEGALPILILLLECPDSEVQDTLMQEEVLQNLGVLLLTCQKDPAIVGLTACIIKNLSLFKNVQRIIESPCVGGLLQAILSTETQEESLHYLTCSLAELAKHEGATLHLLAWTNEPLIKRLVRLAGQQEHTELSFQAASIVRHMLCYDKVMSLLKCHLGEVQHYLMNFLNRQEIRFQQLGISTLGKLQEDPEFSSAFSQSQLMNHLEQIRHQTEETQELLKMATSHKGS